MRLYRLFVFSVVSVVSSQFGAKASQVQTFNVVGYPASNPQVQGSFTVFGSNGLAGPFANGGLGAYGMPSTMTISANGFTFDALSIGVGGINSAIQAETETFIGDLYGGGTVTQTFRFPGNSQNFVTANLVGFNNLVDLRANIGFVTLQNLTYNQSAAPEPGTYGLLGMGLATVCIAYRRRTRRQMIKSAIQRSRS
ncbi:MAG: PEP-CTERM sorting domain-containing protein [Bryobacteraceae bacterium]